MKKRWVWILLSLMAFFMACIVFIPMIVQVDQYRPQIVQWANQRLNGQLELGKLELSLWGGVEVHVSGLKALDTKNQEILSVTEMVLDFPLWTLLKGEPQVTFRMEAPQIQLGRTENQSWNILSLWKSAEPSAKEPEHSAGQKILLPGLLARSRLHLAIQNAKIQIQDPTMRLNTKIEGVQIQVRDLSLERPSLLEVRAGLQTQLFGDLQIQGPIAFTSQIQPELEGSKFKRLRLSLQGNFDSLDIKKGALFHKKPGIRMQIVSQIQWDPQRFQFEDLVFYFHQASVRAQGELINQPPPASPLLQFGINSNEISLASLGEILPSLSSNMGLGGTFNFAAQLSGPVKEIQTKGQGELKDLGTPKIKASGKILLEGERLSTQNLVVQVAETPVSVQLSAQSIAKPKIECVVRAKTIDLDRLMGTTAQTGGPTQDPDQLLLPLKSMGLLMTSTATLDLQIERLRSHGVDLNRLEMKASFAKLVAKLETLQTQVWGGKVQAKGIADLSQSPPLYSFDASTKAVDLGQASQSQLQLLKNTFRGKLDSALNGKGSSLNPEKMKKSLQLQGQFKVTEATFATIDVSKMVSEAINKSIDRAAETVPALKGKRVGSVGKTTVPYELISGRFSLKDGKFNAPDFRAISKPNKGVDLEGATTVDIVTYDLLAKWRVIDRYDLTQARQISVDVGGIRVEHVLAKGNDPVTFPVTVKGKATAPEFDYAEAPEYFAGVLLHNLGEAGKKRAEQELKQKAGEALKRVTEQAPAEVKDALKRFGF